MSEKLVIKAARGETVERTPIWLMRQAGRYLPEYHMVKKKAGGFLGLCKIPEYGVEVTLQPIRRFGFDAAILFSDILIPAEAMGIDLQFSPGPVIGNPVRSHADLKKLRVPEPLESLHFVLDIIAALKSELPRETTLIGFAGAPYTVASYLVEENASKGSFLGMRRLIYEDPDLAQGLIEKIEQTTQKYLQAQVDAGAEVLQLFDSSAGHLPPELYGRFAFEPSSRVIQSLRNKGVPIIYFAPGAMNCLQIMKNIGADVIGIDWRISLNTARAELGEKIAVQGNLDPACLLGARDGIREQIQQALAANAGLPGHIFNLGHGVLPQTPVANVEVLVDFLRSFYEK